MDWTATTRTYDCRTSALAGTRRVLTHTDWTTGAAHLVWKTTRTGCSKTLAAAHLTTTRAGCCRTVTRSNWRTAAAHYIWLEDNTSCTLTDSGSCRRLIRGSYRLEDDDGGSFWLMDTCLVPSTTFALSRRHLSRHFSSEANVVMTGVSLSVSCKAAWWGRIHDRRLSRMTSRCRRLRFPFMITTSKWKNGAEWHHCSEDLEVRLGTRERTQSLSSYRLMNLVVRGSFPTWRPNYQLPRGKLGGRDGVRSLPVQLCTNSVLWCKKIHTCRV